MKFARYPLLVGILIVCCSRSWCQQKDTTQPAPVVARDTTMIMRPGKRSDNTDSPYKVDSVTKKKHNPRKATLYSTFLPGLGQIYNKKYWKLPIVYAAVGIPAYTYFYNKSWYNKCQAALAVLLDTPLTPQKLKGVDPKLQTFVTNGDQSSLRTYRNSFRQDQDYSVLFFLLFWGLNIVDATVDAHLKDFDVSNQISMRIQSGPSADRQTTGFMASANTFNSFSLVFELHKARFKPISLP